MTENLEDKLVKIEKRLGSPGDVPQVRDLGWHLDTIESLIGEGVAPTAQTVQLKKKLIKISAKKTVHSDGDNQTYDYDLTYDFYKKISKKEEEEILADVKQQMPEVTSLQEAIDTVITNEINQLPEDQQSSTFALLAYSFGFDYVETGYFEYNHTDGFYMGEPWVAKGPLFCYMGDTNYEYKMSMVGTFGGSPTQIKPSGTWTTSVTDVIEDEFTIQGKQGNGTSTDVLKNYKETLTFYSQNGNKICDLSKILALKTEEWYYGLLNNGFQDVANTLSLTIPTITNAATVQNGINTILSALHQAGASSDIPAFVVSFATDFDFVIKQKVSNAGNETYPLFITWDASAYIMEAGSFVDLFTKFDFTGAYTVSYSLTEVNVTD